MEENSHRKTKMKLFKTRLRNVLNLILYKVIKSVCKVYPLQVKKTSNENAIGLTSSTIICFLDFAHFGFQQTTSYLKMLILQNQEWFNWKYKLLIFNRLERRSFFWASGNLSWLPRGCQMHCSSWFSSSANDYKSTCTCDSSRPWAKAGGGAGFHTSAFFFLYPK